MNGFKPSTPLSKQDLLKSLKRLTEVSQEIQNTGKSMGLVQNILQHNSLKEKMDRLSQEQAAIVKKIVDTSSDIVAKNDFLKLSRLIGDFQSQVKSAKTAGELNDLQRQIDDTVDRWVELFQKIAFDAIKSSR